MKNDQINKQEGKEGFFLLVLLLLWGVVECCRLPQQNNTVRNSDVLLKHDKQYTQI